MSADRLRACHVVSVSGVSPKPTRFKSPSVDRLSVEVPVSSPATRASRPSTNSAACSAALTAIQLKTLSVP